MRKNLLKDSGVQLVIINPYSPEQNGCAERSNCTIVESARTMRLAKKLLKSLWAEAVNTAVYLFNRSGSAGKDGKAPYKIFIGKSVSLRNLHVFGTGCFVQIPGQKRYKWDANKLGVFVGYSHDIDGVWIRGKKTIVRSKSVVFEARRKAIAVVSTKQKTVAAPLRVIPVRTQPEAELDEDDTRASVIMEQIVPEVDTEDEFLSADEEQVANFEPEPLHQSESHRRREIGQHCVHRSVMPRWI